jgi:hypothetical protein
MRTAVCKLNSPSYLTALLLIGAMLLVVGCGGNSPSPTAGDGDVSTGIDAPPPRSEPVEPTAEPPAPSEIETILDHFLSDPEPAGASEDAPADLLGGSPDYAAGEALAEIVRLGGFDAPGTLVVVLPITGLGESLLVIDTQIDMNAASGDTAGTANDVAFLEALLGSPAFTGANVSRIVIQLRTPGESSVLLMTVATSTLQAVLDGSLSPEEALHQYRYQIIDEAAP